MTDHRARPGEDGRLHSSFQAVYDLLIDALNDRYKDLVAVPYENIATELAAVVVTHYEEVGRYSDSPHYEGATLHGGHGLAHMEPIYRLASSGAQTATDGAATQRESASSGGHTKAAT